MPAGLLGDAEEIEVVSPEQSVVIGRDPGDGCVESGVHAAISAAGCDRERSTRTGVVRPGHNPGR
jgi:hypothetical protein